MTALAKSDYEAYLKDWYPGTNAADLTYDDRPWLGIITKNSGVRGTAYPKPARYTNTVGRSALFGTAHANQAPAKRVKWVNTHADNYSKATVENKVIELSMGDDAAFREALTDAVDAAYGAFADDLHFELFGDGSGTRGTCTTGTTATSLQLLAGEARFFEEGMVVAHALTAGTVLLNSGETTTVTAVDRDDDVVTVAAGWTTDAATTHRIYADGDFGIKANGFKAWLPTYAGIVAGGGGAANVFLTVDRSKDGSRLAGIAGEAGSTAGLEVTEAVVNSAAKGQREGAGLNLGLLHPTDRARLALETEQRARYAKVYSTEGNISFSALVLETGSGAIPIMSDAAQPVDSAYLVDTREWELFSAGGLPSMFDKDGNFYHREETLDTLAFYLYGFYNKQTQKPGKNVYISDLGY
jgi:hypothetical protein